MNVVSLHPIALEVVHRYVGDITGSAVMAGPSPRRDDVEWARRGNETAANRLTYGLALALAEVGPVYCHTDFGLSFWEAQVDRGLGMLLRPPSRMFMDAGLDAQTARVMPIRLDPQLGMMGGAYLPARLVGKALEQFEEHLERTVKRLVNAEIDPLPVTGLMHEALHQARAHGVGLYEAQDVVGPGGEGRPGMEIVLPDQRRWDRDFVEQVVDFATPPKTPGLLQRLFGRPGGANGQGPVY